MKMEVRHYRLTINNVWFNMYLAKRVSRDYKAKTSVVNTGQSPLIWFHPPQNISLLVAWGLGRKVWVAYNKDTIGRFGNSDNWGSFAYLEHLWWWGDDAVGGMSFLFYLPLYWCLILMVYECLWWKTHLPLIQRLRCIFFLWNPK